MKNSVKIVAKQAIICALYIALTVMVIPISYGMIQFRISEIIILLAYYDKKNMIGLTLGVFLANLIVPAIPFDFIIGTIASILSFICINKIKVMYIGAICPVIINAVLVGGEIYFLVDKAYPLIVNMLWVGLGELVVMIVGVIIFKILERNKFIYDNILVG